MAKPINCEDTSDEEGWSYCGKRECVSCGVGDEKKASNDRALRTGWAVVKEDECPCELDSFEEALWKKCVPCIERHNMTVESIGDTTYVLNENQEVVHKW